MSVSEERPVLVDVVNHIGQLTLNRPAGLNTLTQDMVRTIHRQLQDWAADPEIKAVLLRAAGEKAFCAGGDIRALYESFHSDGNLHREFFPEEYALNRHLHAYPKPTLALAQGIVLGGGMGLFQGADTRIVTETARLGMPEVGIGFFPDVGAGYFLPRLPGELGTYLGVTGNHITVADALYCGLADRYLPNAQVQALDEALGQMAWSDDPSAALNELCEGLTKKSLPDPSLQALHPAIDTHFAKASVPEIRQSLMSEERPDYRQWAEETVRTMDSRSPTSMAVALKHIRQGKSQTLEQVLDQDLILAYRLMESGDFMEGIRSLIIDKDKNPRWNPPTLDAVTSERVESLFTKS